MTILFSDVRGFTSISESFKDDPQGLTKLMNRLLTPLTNSIIDRKGTIDKYIGDAIMAFWNAPLDDPSHEVNACAAALDMLRNVGPTRIPGERRVILLDLNMPKMNGLEFLRELRDDPKLKPLTVVVLTTSDDERDRVEAYNLNVAGYILKPVTFTAFVEVMAALNKYWTINEFP